MRFLDNYKTKYNNSTALVQLIIINILLFIIPTIIFAIIKELYLPVNYTNYVTLSSNYNNLLRYPWTILSYSFFHNNILHLVFNMVMLYFSGTLFCTFFTQKQLVSVYVLGGVCGGLVYIASYFMFSFSDTLLLGASASVMAILVATTTYSPNFKLHFTFLGSINLKYLTLGFLLLDILQLPFENTGGHIAHLGGALLGFIYAKGFINNWGISNKITIFENTINSLFLKKKQNTFKKIYKNNHTTTQKPSSKIILKSKEQQQIDEILDKISQSGYDSLSQKEKEFLFTASKQ